MAKMKNISRLPSESYQCPECEGVYENEDVQDTWCCPNCNDPIYVYAEDIETDTRIVLIRVAASKIEEGMMIHLPYQLTKESYQVLGVNLLDNGKLSIGLKGYGAYKVSPADPVNCRMGAW